MNEGSKLETVVTSSEAEPDWAEEAEHRGLYMSQRPLAELSWGEIRILTPDDYIAWVNHVMSISCEWCV